MKLMLGDCLDVMKSIPDGSVDMVCADPPYQTTACKWDTVIPFEPMWEQLQRVAKRNAAIVLFASQPFTSALVMSNPKEFRYEWVWSKGQKSGHLNAKRRPMREHEDVVVFSRGTPPYYPQPNGTYRSHIKGVRKATASPLYGTQNADTAVLRIGERYPSTILPFAKGRHGYEHPTQKPIDLLAYLVRTYTNPGETVLDFCMGSGTCGVAALREGRDFIGIEREQSYFEISQRRIAAERLPLFEEVAD